MSYHLVNKGWNLDLPNAEFSAHGLVVLLRLAHLSVQSTGECCASIPELAVKCRMSDSGVRRQIRVLEELGLVMQIREGRRTHFRLNVVRLNEAPSDA